MTDRIANPIYDSVFKFLMEDNRVARAMLSALLKKKVLNVEMRPQEYTNKRKDRISVFRVDFSALVQEEDGSEHLVLIELQKTWRPTETLRFRRYLAVQYENERNVSSETGEPLPIVSIYLLGHKVDDLKESVVYVRRKYLDYESNEIKEGVPSPFVEQLTHDSIIVQIPYLTDNVRNHLEDMLNVFDQSYVSSETKHMLLVDGRSDNSDEEIRYIYNRLAYAAANPDVRREMDIEDEILGELENLDTTIAKQKEQISQQEEQISQQEEQISQQKEQISQKDEQLSLMQEELNRLRALLKQ